MLWLRLVLVTLLLTPAAACSDDDDPSPWPPVTYSEEPPVPPAPTPPSYQVLDADCPAGWSGLLVTTDSDVEVEYLDDLPACTNATGTATYLENRSDAVWRLQSSGGSGVLTRGGGTLAEASFLSAVQGVSGELPVLVPRSSATVDLPPAQVQWAIDLRSTVGWEAHELVLEKIEQAGEAAAVSALRRQSAAGAALAACTLAAVQHAEAVQDLEDADVVDVVLSGLGVGTAYSTCSSESAAVTTLDDAGRPVALADDLQRLSAQTTTLQALETRLGYAQRASRLLGLGLTFVR